MHLQLQVLPSSMGRLEGLRGLASKVKSDPEKSKGVSTQQSRKTYRKLKNDQKIVVPVALRQLFVNRHGEPALQAESRDTVKVGPKTEYDDLRLKLQLKTSRAMFHATTPRRQVCIKGKVIIELGHKDLQVNAQNWDQMRTMLRVTDATLRFDYHLEGMPVQTFTRSSAGESIKSEKAANGLVIKMKGLMKRSSPVSND